VPRERDCLRVLIEALRGKPRSSEQLDASVRGRFGSALGEAEATTLRAGAVGRFVDLGLVKQNRGPDGTVWGLSEVGESVWKRIGR